MVNTFSVAQLRAAKIAADLEGRIKRMHRDCTPAEAVMAFALLATKFDVVWKFDPKNPRACRDLMIAAAGGVQSIDWNKLDILPESPSDQLSGVGEALVEATAPGEAKGDAL